jgi:hypothetical protein
MRARTCALSCMRSVREHEKYVAHVVQQQGTEPCVVHLTFFMFSYSEKCADFRYGGCHSAIFEGFEISKMAAKMASGAFKLLYLSF